MPDRLTMISNQIFQGGTWIFVVISRWLWSIMLLQEVGWKPLKARSTNVLYLVPNYYLGVQIPNGSVGARLSVCPENRPVWSLPALKPISIQNIKNPSGEIHKAKVQFPVVRKNLIWWSVGLIRIWSVVEIIEWREIGILIFWLGWIWSENKSCQWKNMIFLKTWRKEWMSQSVMLN